MAPASSPTVRTVKPSLQSLKNRIKATNSFIGETRAKLAKMERGIVALQGLKRKRAAAVGVERAHMDQTTAELQALRFEAHEVAEDFEGEAKRVVEEKEMMAKRKNEQPVTPLGKMTPQYNFCHESRQQQQRKASRYEEDSRSDSDGDMFVDASQERIVPPAKEKKRESCSSDETGFVSARQSVEDPFAE